MHFWLVSIFENTPLDDNQNTRFNAIANEALKRGHKVTFWASTFKHNVKSQRFPKTTKLDINDRLSVHYVRSLEYQSNTSLKRLYSHRRLAMEFIKEVKKAEEKPDVIFVAYPPISLVFKLTRWAEKTEIPVIVDIIDPWPDSYRKKMKFLSRGLQNLVLSPMISKTRYIFRKASAVTGIAEQRLTWAKTYNSKINKLEYYYPAVYLKEMQKTLSSMRRNGFEKPNKLRVIYAGSLESSYDIPTILKAADILSDEYNDEIEFIIAGAGYQKALIDTYTNKKENLRYLGRIPKDELMKEYAMADLGLIQHHKNATQTVTYKLFDLLGSGLPVMNSLESELNDILLKYKVGLFNTPGNAIELARNIEYCHRNRDQLENMKKRAVEVTSTLGDAEVVYSKTVDLMEEIAVAKINL